MAAKPDETKSDATSEEKIIPPNWQVLNPDDDDVEADGDDFPEDFPEYPSESVVHFLEDNKVNILERREDTRGRLAIIYTLATFSMFVLGFVVAVLDASWTGNSIVENLSTILPLISGIFLGSLGFVLGYYFRRMDSEDVPAPVVSRGTA